MTTNVDPVNNEIRMGLTAVVPLLWAYRAYPLTDSVAYRWGVYCGWTLLLAVAEQCTRMIRQSMMPDAFSVLFAVVAASGGLGLLLRRRYGVVCFFIAAVVVGLRQIVTFGAVAWHMLRDRSSGWHEAAGITGFYVILLSVILYYSTDYYSRRWALLR